ncbi:MAG TPA: hypothetical protein VM532_18135 [Burkholderiales bacterium]|jgi:hypothetical protein|nr:hypothetical protein [Burkholderiales bacterium]
MSTLKQLPVGRAECPDNSQAIPKTASTECRQTIAAEQSAATAAMSNQLAIASAVLSFFGLLAVLASLWQTRKALYLAKSEYENSRADADIANRHTSAALDVARDSAAAATRLAITTEAHGKLRTRAYVYVEVARGDVKRGEPVSIEFKLRNQGETPALAVQCATAVVVRRVGWDWSLEPDSNELPLADQVPAIILGSGQDALINHIMDEPLPDATYDAIKAANAAVYARATVFYKSLHGDDCETVFGFEFFGEESFRTGRPRLSTKCHKFT